MAPGRTMPGFGLNSWTTGDAVDAATDIRVAGAAGYQFVELRDWKLEQHLAKGGTVATLKSRADAAGLGILSVNTLDDATLPVSEQQEARRARCRQLCAWAAELGSPYVIVGPSYQPEQTIPAETVHRR